MMPIWSAVLVIVVVLFVGLCVGWASARDYHEDKANDQFWNETKKARRIRIIEGPW